MRLRFGALVSFWKAIECANDRAVWLLSTAKLSDGALESVMDREMWATQLRKSTADNQSEPGHLHYDSQSELQLRLELLRQNSLAAHRWLASRIATTLPSAQFLFVIEGAFGFTLPQSETSEALEQSLPKSLTFTLQRQGE